MHRLTVFFLAAVDAAIAVAVGIAATLAPLTLLWVFGLGGSADWTALWPSSVTIWQFGNLVPMLVTLPGDYLAATGIDPDAASFTLSLAPLAFASFTAVFAVRSGVRASQADAWATGVIAGAIVFGGLTAVAGVTAQNSVAGAPLWQAILVPTLVYALPCLCGAVVTEWREAGSGPIARLRDRVEASPAWGPVPGLVGTGTAVVVVGLVGFGAAIAAVAILLRGGEIVALFQAGNVDALGATVLTLAQLAYLPTLVVWGMAFGAGPGFVVGDGGVVSPSGTQIGVVPGIPILGAVPESTSAWLLLLALVPVGLGAFAGWIARSRLVAPGAPDRFTAGVVVDDERTAALSGLLAAASPASVVRPHADPFAPRLVTVVALAVLSGAAAALLSAVASGSLGPGRLAFLGPEAGPVALAVGLEVLVGAAILLLAPRGASASEEDAAAAAERRVPESSPVADEPHPSEPRPEEPRPEWPRPDEPRQDWPGLDEPGPDEPLPDEPEPDEPEPPSADPLAPDHTETLDLGPRKS
ncbi:MAG: cell division protein PerM, partial [Microbacterium sp.]